MLQNLTGWHALIVLAVVLLIFGAAKLPALARSLGQSVRILKTEASDARADAVAEPDPQVAAASQSASARASASPVVTGPSTPSKT